jgi:DNA-binding MarR family transcriptional regulator
MGDPSRIIGSAVRRLTAASIRQHGALATRLESTTTDVLALDYVVAAPGIAPGHLARALLVSPSGATSVIDRLSGAGLISRVPTSGRYRVALEATDAGRDLHAQALGPLCRDAQRLVEDLPRSHRAVVEEFLTRVADLAEREADGLVARAQADARAAGAIPPPVLWG